jgi:hypothetical protein
VQELRRGAEIGGDVKKGMVRISPRLLTDGFILPSHWHLESIHMDSGDYYAVAIISGPEFPEVPDGSAPKHCEIIVHKETLHFEVKETP